MGTRAKERCPINEPVFIPETFVTGIADYEEFAGCVRVAFYAEKNLLVAGVDAPKRFPRERIIQAKLVMPIACQRQMMWQVLNMMRDSDAAAAMKQAFRVALMH